MGSAIVLAENKTMTLNKISVAIGGGYELDRAALGALIAGLPGLRVVPLKANPPPQVLVWQMRKATDELPSVRSNTAILLLTEDAGFESLPETITGLFSKDEPPASLGIAIRQVARGEQYLSPSLAAAILDKRQVSSLLTESEKS